LRTLINTLRGDLDWIVMKCLEKDRGRRYETANGLAADLKRHLNNEPVTARPPSTVYRFQKAWRRNKLAYTAGLAVATALVAGIAVSAWQAMRANRMRLVAEDNARKAGQAENLAHEKSALASAEAERRRRELYASEMMLAFRSWESRSRRAHPPDPRRTAAEAGRGGPPGI
jgi:hypothetical protein